MSTRGVRRGKELLTVGFFLLAGLAMFQGHRVLAGPQDAVPDATGALSGSPTPLFAIAGDAQGEFERPMAVTEGPGGSIYVADGGAGLVRTFDAAGLPLRTFGGDPGPAKLGFPTGLAFDDGERLYVADSSRRAVLVFSAGGAFQGTFGDALGRPGAIFFKSGSFYVSDLMGQRVLVLNREGGIVRRIGLGPGDGPGQFHYPNCVWAGDDGRIYVSDSNNNRVQAFEADGALAGVLSGGGGRPMELPRGLAQDRFGRLHVVSTLGHRIDVYDPASAQQLFSYGEGADRDGGWGFPNGLSITARRIYVTQTGTRRVQVLSY